MVHCLNPDPSGATYLEEAVATAFSQQLVFSRFGQRGLGRTSLSQDCSLALETAADIDRDVVRLGKRLRDTAGSLRRVRPETVRQLYPHTPAPIVQQQLEMFPRWEQQGY